MYSIAKELLLDLNWFGKIIMAPMIYVGLTFVGIIMIVVGVVMGTIINIVIFFANLMIIKKEPYLKYNWVFKLVK